MKTSDPLHELIHSLEQTEKRHFKIYAKRHILNGENQYLRLFDAVETLTEYDENAIKRQLGNTAFAKNLASGKNYLYNLILRSLRNYHANKSVRTSLYELWLDSNILMEKGLLKQATKLIHKAKKLAAAYQYDIPMLELMILERKLIRRYTSNRANELIRKQQKDSAMALQRVDYRLKMLDLYETIFLNYRNQNEAQLSLAETVQQAEKLFLEHQAQATSFEALKTYYLLRIHHANLTKNFQQANHHLRELIDLFEQYSSRAEEDPEGYLGLLNNYLGNCFILNNIEELPTILTKMEAIKANSFTLRATLFQSVFYLKILYNLVKQNYQEVIRLVPAVERGLQTFGKNITKSRQLTFYYNISIAYFLEKDYSSALEWINRILNEPKLEERQDIQSLARIFRLVIHFELGDYDFVDSLILSANRYLIKKDKRHSAEFLIIRHLKEALYSDKKERQAVFSQLAEALKEEKGLEEIKIWVQSKVQPAALHRRQ